MLIGTKICAWMNAHWLRSMLLLDKVSALVYVLMGCLWRIVQRNVRGIVILDMLSPLPDTVCRSVLEIHKPLLIFLIKCVFIDA